MNVGDKIKLAVRVGKHPKNIETLCRCWPMSPEGRKVMEAAHITEIQFNGDQKKFTVGTEITGEAIITAVDDAKALSEDGTLQPRLKLDADGSPVSENGKDVVLKRISVRFVSGGYKRAAAAEEVLKEEAA